MSRRVEHAFFVDAPPARVWAAFAEGEQRAQWEACEYEIDARPGGRVRWTLPGIVSEGEVLEVVPGRLLRHAEGTGSHGRTEVRVELEPSGSGTNVRVTHDGFEDGEASEWTLQAIALGWAQAISDLQFWLEQGIPADRFRRSMCHAGLWFEETPAGLKVKRVDAGGYADRAGLVPGDVLLAFDGVPVFTRPEVWVALRAHTAGQKLRVEFARQGERREATALL